MDYEHTLTAADVKIRAQHASSIATTLSAGWPQTPFIAEGRWSERSEDQGATATLATGRTVASAAEVTIWDVAHYLTDVVAGIEAGLHTILVLTGIMGVEEIETFPYRPTEVMASIADLLEPAPQEEDQ